MSSKKPESIWNVAFALLCAAQFLGYAQYFLLQPTLALYVTHLGGTPSVIGLVIASFSVTSVLSRPFIGYCADCWSKTGVLILGLLVQAISILLCFIPLVGATMLANSFRGIGWAGMNTGGYTLLATNAPATRRAEASGYYGSAQSSATILFPAVALWIIHASFGGFHAVFIVAMVLLLLGAGVGVALSYQTTYDPPGLPADSSESWWRSIINVFDRSIVLPATLLFCLNLPASCLTSFIVLYANKIGISNFGWYFVVTGVTNLLARPLLGRVSDRIGGMRSLVVALHWKSSACCYSPWLIT
ncbi:MAG: MFS transporter [Desulfobacterales bacterium]|nr:MFS transporter [Desulfobacterales bacterium]